jgi:hypothetical protein
MVVDNYDDGGGYLWWWWWILMMMDNYDGDILKQFPT